MLPQPQYVDPISCPSTWPPRGNGIWPSLTGRTTPWLTFGIPTIGRPQSYLVTTLQSLALQLPVSHLLATVVVVHNLSPPPASIALEEEDNNNNNANDDFPTNDTTMWDYHKWFDIEHKTRASDLRFDFVRMQNPLVETHDTTDQGESNIPGARVRQQTRDLINTLRQVWQRHHPEYHVIMEDDFVLCPDAMRVITYLIHRAPHLYGKDWLTIRISYGFNGVILHGEDLIPLSNYLERHIMRRPPDHLLVEWFAGEHPESLLFKQSRVHGCFRYNLLHHLGLQSTLRNTATAYMAGCYFEFTPFDLFEVEVFNTKECGQGNEDMWPCSGAAMSCPSLGIQGWRLVKNESSSLPVGVGSR